MVLLITNYDRDDYRSSYYKYNYLYSNSGDFTGVRQCHSPPPNQLHPEISLASFPTEKPPILQPLTYNLDDNPPYVDELFLDKSFIVLFIIRIETGIQSEANGYLSCWNLLCLCMPRCNHALMRPCKDNFKS